MIRFTSCFKYMFVDLSNLDGSKMQEYCMKYLNIVFYIIVLKIGEADHLTN